MQDTGKKRGYDISLTIMDAANSQRTQDDQVQEMIGNGCDILCVNLADRTDPSQIITAAQEHDIPIIFFNREPVEEDLMQWDQFILCRSRSKTIRTDAGTACSRLYQRTSGCGP